MERDVRRDQGQWRGCHALQKQPNEAGFAANKRSGGGPLRMGQTYHYYYEVNGTQETHDPRQPTTTTCPSLPGQIVNTLEVPTEHSLRFRSCSMNNLRQSDYKTINPKHKFKTPMPPQPSTVAAAAPDVRVGSAPAIQLMRKRSARSLSPSPKWTASARKIFGTIRPSSREGNGSARTLADWDADVSTLGPAASPERARSVTPSGSTRSRDISPDSLRRFLLGEDIPTAAPAELSKPVVWNHDDMIEDNDDDDNFATLTTSPTLDNMPFTTLSPPSFMRSTSTQLPLVATGLSAPPPPPHRPPPIVVPSSDASPANTIQLRIPKSRFIARVDSPTALSPTSHTSGESRGDKSQVSFFDESEDEVAQDRTTLRRSPAVKSKTSPAFSGYRLPQPAIDGSEKGSGPIAVAFGSPSIVAQAGDGVVMPLGHPDVLSLPQIEDGLGDLVDDLSWITGIVSSKNA